MQCGDQIRAVIHGHVRLMIKRRAQVAVVGGVVFAFDRKHRDFVLRNQRRRHVILGGQRIGSGYHNIRAACLQSAHQIRRFGGYVHAGCHSDALERTFLAEAFLERGQYGHFPRGPIHAAPAALGQVDVFDVIILHSISVNLSY